MVDLHGTYEFDLNDPLSTWFASQNDVQNFGDDGAIPGQHESRYFTTQEDYEAFKASGDSLDAWFSDGGGYENTGDGKAWAGMNEEERELQVYRAGQRIEHTYKGAPDGVDGDAAHYPRVSGKERFEAERRLGVEHGSLY